MWAELWSSLWIHLFVALRPMFKWIVRRVTGKCELLRITYDHEAGAARTRRIEKSMKQSRQTVLKQVVGGVDVDVSAVVSEVMTLKNIIPEVHPRFQHVFTVCVCQICGYQQLLARVEQWRREKYNSNDKKHEEKLMQLWKLMMPNTRLESRITDQWTEIGFQGSDPATDFRGMGILSLDQLLYFMHEYPDVAKSLFSQSNHPQYGFSFAILGITFTSISYELLKLRKLRTHFYNLTEETATMQQFNEVYCHLFYEFVQFWIRAKPKDIMEFGKQRDKFQKSIVQQLKDSQTILRSTFQERERLQS